MDEGPVLSFSFCRMKSAPFKMLNYCNPPNKRFLFCFLYDNFTNLIKKGETSVIFEINTPCIFTKEVIMWYPYTNHVGFVYMYVSTKDECVLAVTNEWLSADIHTYLQ